ncbi:transcription antitermination factor NusB [Shuttleworthella sp. MSX8B]|uniref:transcription antitermination factor NusB n=1 Tax=Shuttleworthella sp. MSX8B TaxID=936574 RepID=UPI000446087A|nr:MULTISPECIES: transcription antitermination factor NusB [Shuttleworthia]EUB16099.1 transcription antitermination factor NusB [Shuttleworthia sp. MSX8B]
MEKKTMIRRQIRETAFRILFVLNFCPADQMQDQLNFYFTDHTELEIDDLTEEEDQKAVIRLDQASWPEITAKCLGAAGHLPEIDRIIEESSEGWKLSRLTKVDLTLLRLAVYEMKFENLPSGIAINEAVELAKRYGTDKSPAFVNGVLAKIS